MIKPKSDQVLPVSPHSRVKILFVCDCGNEKEIIWKNYMTNHTKSCGKCKNRTKYNIDKLVGRKFGHLRIDKGSIPDDVSSKSRVRFLCDCGGFKEVVLKSVVNGLTRSCGCGLARVGRKWVRPDYKSREYWLQQDLPLELLTPVGDLPEKWPKASNRKFRWLCGCGRDFISSFGHVFSGHASSCGRCDFVCKEFYLDKKFGKLRLLDIDLPVEFHKNTDEKFWFLCDCGVKKQISIHSVVKNKQVSCGDCNLKPKEWWVNRVFGHLTVLNTLVSSIKTRSEEHLECQCSCGSVCSVQACALIRGNSKTCGNCLDVAHRWHASHNFPPPKRRKFSYHCSPGLYHVDDLVGYFDGSLLVPLESVRSMDSYMKFRCKLCGGVFKTKLAWIYYDKIMSCGCVKGSFSFESVNIGRFIESFGVKCLYGKSEKKFGPYSIDVYVPDKDLIIEYNGLRYHKSEKDIRRYVALKGHQYMLIYEDEWLRRRGCFERLLLNRVGVNFPSVKLRPRECVVKLVECGVARDFYERFHYQGYVHSSFNVGVLFNDKLVACMSIKRPSRQLSGDWEVSRMACDFNVRVHGLWSFLIKWVKREKLISGRLITFSDNRLMTGGVYERMGFVRVGDVKPDYYWVKGNKRFHKSGLRKTKEEKKSGLTEIQLRSSQGYSRIYDLGKVKWELVI